MKKTLFILLCLLISAVTFADESGKPTETFDIEFSKPIEINLTKTASAKISSLSVEAKEAGYDVMLLQGDITYENAGNNETRVYITWKSLFNGTLTQPLTTEFVSQFRTDDPVVKVGQLLTAAGNRDDLSTDMYAFKDRIVAGETDPEMQTSEASGTSESDGLNNAPDYFSGGSVGGGSFGGTSAFDPDNSDLDDIDPIDPKNNQVTTEACELRIDYTKGKEAGYLQSKEITTNLITGEKTNGVCKNTGETVPFLKEFSKECGLLKLHGKKAAYKQFKEFVNYGGQKIEVVPCTPDLDNPIPYEKVYDDINCPVEPVENAGIVYVQFRRYIFDNFIENKKIEVQGCTNLYDKSYDLIATNSECGYKTYPVKGKSFLQHKYQYENSAGDTIDASDCRDSDVSFDNYWTDFECEAKEYGGKLVLYKQLAFTDGNKVTHYPFDCVPMETGAVPFITDFCEDRYVDNLVTGQSFFNKRKYYVDTQQKEHEILPCAADIETVFEHEWVQCEGKYYEHFDDKLQTIIPYRLVVFMDGKTRVLKDCEAKSKIEIMPYEPAGKIEKIVDNGTPGNHTFTVPPGVSRVNLLLVGAGYSTSTGHFAQNFYHKGKVFSAVYPVQENSKINYTVGKKQSDIHSLFGNNSSNSGIATGYGQYGQASSSGITSGYVKITYILRKYERYDGTEYIE